MIAYIPIRYIRKLNLRFESGLDILLSGVKMKTQNTKCESKNCGTCRRYFDTKPTTAIKTEQYWLAACPQCGSSVTWSLQPGDEKISNQPNPFEIQD